MFKFKIKKIKELPYYFAEHCFGFFIILVFFAMICGGFLFYKYNIVAANKQIENLNEPLKFEEKTYQEILQTWESQKQKIEQSEFKQYPSLFQADEPEPEPESEEEQETESID